MYVSLKDIMSRIEKVLELLDTVVDTVALL